MRARILSASAGAGKTDQLAYKFVHDVVKHFPTKPYLYRAILAVTFTNKATEEMKSRILEKLNELITKPEGNDYMKDLKRDLGLQQEEIIKRAKQIQTSILHDYSRFTILTIDKFFQRILRAFIKELGIDLNYNIELDTSSVLTKCTDSLIEDISTNEELEKWIYEFAQECNDEGKDWDIRKIINELGEEIFKEGNKETIEESMPKAELRKVIAEGEKRVKEITDSLTAMGAEALEIIANAGLEVSDFSRKSQGGAGYFENFAAGQFSRPNSYQIAALESPDKWITADTKKNKALKAQLDAAVAKLHPMLVKMYETFIANEKLLTTLPCVKKTYRSFALLHDIYNKVKEQCDSEGMMLLPETKYILSRFIAGNDAPFIYEKIGNRFERYMIDEFQDTSAQEWGNFLPLLQNAMAQAEDESVLIVGDVKQSIYRWRGGDWSILNGGVQGDLGKENTFTKPMQENWRSLPQIVEFNNEMIGEIVKHHSDELDAELESAAKNGQISENCKENLTGMLANAYTDHTQTSMKSSEERGYVRIDFYNKDEQLPIIKCIESAIARGYQYKDILILCRGKSTIKKVADILLEYKQQNNDFNIMTQEALIVGKALISQFVIAVLRLSQNRADNLSLAIINSYLQRPYNQPLSQEDGDLVAGISQLTPEEAFERIVKHFKLNEHRGELAYLQAVHEQIINFCAMKIVDIQLFLKEWDEKGFEKSLSVEMSDNTIEVTTIHKAKGLERKVVILPCDWGLNPYAGEVVWSSPAEGDDISNVGRFPVKYNNDTMSKSFFADDYYRERIYSHIDNINILYVALTRASEEMYLFVPSYSKSKDFEENNVSKLVWERAVANKFPTLKGEIKEGDYSLQYVEYGTPIKQAKAKQKESKVENVLVDCYPTAITKMSLRLSEQRYFEDAETSITPRNMGIEMHSILSQAKNIDDITQRIDSSFEAGRLSAEQRDELKQVVEREFQREQVKEWFTEWDVVRNENDILISRADESRDEKTGTLRPDRVMIRGERAVVVDYKFGLKQYESHRKKMADYMQLLKQMGYAEVEGYVWYLSMGEIVRV